MATSISCRPTLLKYADDTVLIGNMKKDSEWDCNMSEGDYLSEISSFVN